MHHRFFIDQETSAGSSAVLEGEEGHHAVRVSRVRKGERIELITPSAQVFEAEVTELGREGLRASVLEPLPSRESSLELTLAMALVKPDLFELVLRKGTELGVSRFVPLRSDYVEKKALRGEAKRDRWERIVREAVKQSGRGRIPSVSETKDLADLVEGSGNVFVLDAGGEAVGPGTLRELTICVGPEGGWSERELAMIDETGRIRLSLGPRRLRAETAALAGSVWAQMTFGDFRGA